MAANRPQRPFLVTLGLTFVVAFFLPVSWIRPWSNVLAGLVSIPVQPLGDFGVRLARWIWPPQDPLAHESPRVQQLSEQLEIARQTAHVKQLRIEALQEELRELQQARQFHGGAVPIDTLYARITGRGPDRAGGLVRLNVGRRNGVTPDAVAVFRGVHLVGRVAEDVGRVSCWLISLTDPASGYIEVALVPLAAPDLSRSQVPRIQVQADGRGGLVGEIDRDVRVSPGDVAELHDMAWPQSAQGMKVGIVESVSPKESQPLLNNVVIRPEYQAHRLSSVILKIERVEALADGGQP